MKLQAGAVIVMVLTAACGGGSSASSPSGPPVLGTSPDAWAQGTWAAVRMNGQPLPFQDSPAYPYVTYDSLTVAVLFVGTSKTASIIPSRTLHFSANSAPSQIVCGDVSSVSIGTTTLSTRVAGVTTTVGNCNASTVAFDFTRLGDSLAGTWGGVSVRLVKK